MWLTKLKIAIVEKNVDAIDKLLDDLPQFSDAKEIEQAIYLLKETSNIIESLKGSASESMKQIQKNLKFLRATDIPTSKRLDIRS